MLTPLWWGPDLPRRHLLGMMKGWQSLLSVDFCASLTPFWDSNFEHELMCADVTAVETRSTIFRRLKGEIDAVPLDLFSPRYQP